jgi:hypothetical protein
MLWQSSKIGAAYFEIFWQHNGHKSYVFKTKQIFAAHARIRIQIHGPFFFFATKNGKRYKID